MGYKKLTDTEWDLIDYCFPKQHRGRPRQWSDRDVLNAVFYILHNGTRWNDLPRGEFPPSTTAFDRYCLWLKTGVLKGFLSDCESVYLSHQPFI